jgi:hypothetical protein
MAEPGRLEFPSSSRLAPCLGAGDFQCALPTPVNQAQPLMAGLGSVPTSVLALNFQAIPLPSRMRQEIPPNEPSRCVRGDTTPDRVWRYRVGDYRLVCDTSIKRSSSSPCSSGSSVSPSARLSRWLCVRMRQGLGIKRSSRRKATAFDAPTHRRQGGAHGRKGGALTAVPSSRFMPRSQSHTNLGI